MYENDFLIAKKTISLRDNILPLEVKSSKIYTLTPIKKFISKYGDIHHPPPYVIHVQDLEGKGGIIYLPLYTTTCL